MSYTHTYTHKITTNQANQNPIVCARKQQKKIDGYTKLIEKPFDKHFLLQNGLQLSATILGVLIVVHNLFQKKKKNKKDIATTIHIGPLKWQVAWELGLGNQFIKYLDVNLTPFENLQSKFFILKKEKRH